MITYIVRRLLESIVVILLVTIATFIVIRLLPGNPLLIYAHSRHMTTLTPETQERLTSELGLDKPIVVQYTDWVGGIFHGDLGYSSFLNQSVWDALKQRLPVTAYLGIITLLISAIIGPTIGVICAIRRGTWIDSLLTSLSNLGMTAPQFWLGVLLIWVFSLKLKVLPVLGYVSPSVDFVESIRHIILPVVCLSMPTVTGLARQTRSSILEVVRQEYVRVAWSKGLSERMVVTRHILKNGFIPVVTILGMYIATILSGVVLIETVFNINGIGLMMVNSVFNKDFVVLQAGTILMALSTVAANLLVDISYGWFDPRIRYD